MVGLGGVLLVAVRVLCVIIICISATVRILCVNGVVGVLGGSASDCFG